MGLEQKQSACLVPLPADFSEGGKIILTELLPLKVYPFPTICLNI